MSTVITNCLLNGANSFESMKNVVEAFQRQVSVNPSQIAVVAEDGKLTFQELDMNSDAIAEYLHKQGVGPGQVVACMLERSTLAITAILGVAKTGGIYFFVDSRGPKKRITEILKNSQAKIFLTSEKMVMDLELRCDLQLKDLASKSFVLKDEDTKQDICQVVYLINKVDQVDLVMKYKMPTINSIDPAYIIYTSGSTGKPKGCINTHQGVLNLIDGLAKTIYKHFKSQQKIALVAPFVFDPSIQQIFAALLLGHQLYIVPEVARQDGNLLAKFLIDNQIDIADGTPTQIKMLAHAKKSIGNYLPVKHFIIGGEMFLKRDIHAFYGRYTKSNSIVTNIYGVAECTVDSASFTIDRGYINLACRNVIPIGRPLAGTKIYILDEQLRPVSDGVVGELYIGGNGVGKGYLYDDLLTKQKFVPNPFAPGETLYRTGDLAEYCSDGEIVLHGRNDGQMKVGARRVDPSEIESALRSFIPENKGSNELLTRNSKHSLKILSLTCKKCLLKSTHPGVFLDEQGICNKCHRFEQWRSSIEKYFRSIKDFEELMSSAIKKKQNNYDCMLLFSGGKDSTYVLHQLCAQGYKVLPVVFDNGYISDSAFENIKHSVQLLGIEHIVLRTDYMDEIFSESLKNDSTVCGGCFKALTVLSTKLAQQYGINVIITGLSRGQIITTKLNQLFEKGIFDLNDIEQQLLLYRKFYHAKQDKIASLLNTPISDEVIDGIHFVDFFRYDDSSNEEVMTFLRKCDIRFQRPQDTGFCSTNCRANDVGIYIHQVEKGFHNYAEPLSWDIRLGKMAREEGLKKTEGQVDEDSVQALLAKIGYDVKKEPAIIDAVVIQQGDILEAYVVVTQEFSDNELTQYLQRELPLYMVPNKFIRLTNIPITVNGKVDRLALSKLHRSNVLVTLDVSNSLTQGTELQERIRKIWISILEEESIGLDDDFFRLGGTSLKATLLLAAIEEEFNIGLDFHSSLAIYPNIRELTNCVELALTPINLKDVNSNVILLRASDSKKHNIFFLHDALGTTSGLIPLAEELVLDFNVWGIEPKKPFSFFELSLEGIATEYIHSIRQIQPKGPYYLSGWSFGGILAYEITRQFNEIGESVSLLAIIDSNAPNQEIWQQQQSTFFDNLRNEIPPVWLDIPLSLDNAKKATFALEKLYQKGYPLEKIIKILPFSVVEAIPHKEALESANTLLPIVQLLMKCVNILSNYAACTQVKAKSVCLFQALDSKKLTAWPNELFSSIPQSIELNGTHYTILSRPNLEKLAQQLNYVLATVEKE